MPLVVGVNGVDAALVDEAVTGWSLSLPNLLEMTKVVRGGPNGRPGQSLLRVAALKSSKLNNLKTL